jgi:hypothetical protein
LLMFMVGVALSAIFTCIEVSDLAIFFEHLLTLFGLAVSLDQ